MHDGIGIWLAARRLHQGGFARNALTQNTALSRAQFDALVLGLPWERIGEDVSEKNAMRRSRGRFDIRTALRMIIADPDGLREHCSSPSFTSDTGVL